MKRLGRVLGAMAYVAVGLTISWILIGLGYWVSDIMYDAGLWPLGALMRIFLLFGILGLLFSVLGGVFFIGAALFSSEDESAGT